MDVTLVLTHDCNLGCGYCYAGAKFNRRMSGETALKCLDLAFADASGEVQLSFFGGEPLLCWDLLMDVAREARARARADERELKMSVTTNGTLLTDDRAVILDELGVYVGLSTDGVQQAQDEGRPTIGGGSSFAETTKGIEALVRRGTPFETISVVTPTNARWLSDSVRWLVDLGVPRVGLNPCYEAYFDDAQLEAYGQGLATAADVMLECFRSGRIVSMPVFDNKILAALKGGLAETDMCSLGTRSVAVAPSGNLYPCERMVGEDEDSTFLMGHIDTGPEPLGLACPRGPINTECRDCGERWRCQSFCACSNYAETGNTAVAGGTQCWHERQTAVLADRIATTLWEERNPLFIAWFYGRVTSLGAVLEEETGPRRKADQPAAVVPRRPEDGDRRRLRTL